MKSLIMVLSVLFFQSLFSQEFKGKAFYQTRTIVSKFNSHDKDLTPEMEALINEKLKKHFEKSFVLTFTNSESIYEEQEKLSNENVNSGIKIMSFGGANKGRFYKNLKTNSVLAEEDLLGKEFLVTSKLEKFDWKIKEETKKIGDFLCQKAVCIIPVNDEQKNEYQKMMQEASSKKQMYIQMKEPKDQEIVAWFSLDIPVCNGPGNFGGLPGLILEVNDGETVYLCDKIVLNSKEKLEIKIPNTGKKVTKSEFEILMKEKMEEVNNRGGSGPVLRMN